MDRDDWRMLFLLLFVAVPLCLWWAGHYDSTICYDKDGWPCAVQTTGVTDGGS